eukprot:TRINITY_DN81234_c0_g1_i1.p1 TRINITY_DN81234_c0_g1~~TRINITY_DN81234_c0_g1_i1.p1  ORF type:complete len:453 (+),score=140.80 TRINITY_DN81234_c0_g1_i1:100-1458(+)
MGGQILDVGDISFFQLDKLFSQSARAQERRRRRRRAKAGVAEDGADDRSRSPARFNRPKFRKVTYAFGGFTGSVNSVERTIIVTGVPPGADEKVVFKHFIKCGTIRDVRLLRNKEDAVTGVVVIEFEHDDSVVRACGLPPQMNDILGQQVTVRRADVQIIKPSTQKRPTMTRQQFTQQVLNNLKGGGDSLSGAPAMRKLHIKNLRPVVTEDDMRGIFKPFGEFDDFEMGNQECWITFKSANDAQDAMTSMQGFQLVGQELQISMESAPPPAVLPIPSKAAGAEPSTIDSSIARDSDFGATGAGGNGVQNRLELMQKLLSSHQQGNVPTVVADPAAAPSALQPETKPGGPTSRTLLLKHMFSPQSVNLSKEPRFFEEIREDTHDECTKFGKVLHVTVDPRGATGLIYVLYEAPSQRLAAETALNNRWFEGKKIEAMGIDDSIWQALSAESGSS